MNSTKFDNFLTQEFSFPKPLILYILENASSYLLKKLNKICKYLFLKRNFAIIDKLLIFEETLTQGYKESISGYDITLHVSKLDQLKNNLWITDELRAYYTTPKLSSIVNKIVKCDIKLLNVFENDVTFNEFKILTASGNIKKIFLQNPIQYSDGTNLALDDLLLMIPKASNRISNGFVSKNTPKNLSLLKHQAKIRVFLVDIKQKIDVEIMNKFLVNNLDNESMIEIYFEDDEENNIFGRQLYNKIQTWKPKERKPKYIHLGPILTPPPNEWPLSFEY